jgi:uncharacterized protein (TIGR03000 family)
MKKMVTVAALGVVTLLTAMPTSADAYFFGRYRTWYRPGWSYRHTWQANYYYLNASPWFYAPVAGTAPAVVSGASYSAYYPPAPAIDANAATIQLRVPASARIWIEGEQTAQTGTDRSFVSPPLVPGYDYVYRVRVQWNEDGKAVERNRDVTMHAGDRINLTIDR